jgi:hypothetical protein
MGKSEENVSGCPKEVKALCPHSKLTFDAIKSSTTSSAALETDITETMSTQSDGLDINPLTWPAPL